MTGIVRGIVAIHKLHAKKLGPWPKPAAHTTANLPEDLPTAQVELSSFDE